MTIPGTRWLTTTDLIDLRKRRAVCPACGAIELVRAPDGTLVVIDWVHVEHGGIRWFLLPHQCPPTRM